MKNVLFTGSREINSEMSLRTVEYLTGLSWEDVHIIVGDAEGIDTTVIDFCDSNGIPPEVHGGYGRMRHQTRTGRNIPHDTDYLKRDRIMVDLLNPNRDEVIAVWNGKSTHSGTYATAWYAKTKFVKVTWIYRSPKWKSQ